MPEFTWTGIIAIASASVTVIVTAVPLFKYIAERLDQRKKDKRERETTQISISTEMAKIEAGIDESTRAELWRLMEDYKRKYEESELRNKELEVELEEAEDNALLSRPKKREINALLLKLSRNLNSMEKGFEEKYHVLELQAIFNSIKKQFIELEDLMP